MGSLADISNLQNCIADLSRKDSGWQLKESRWQAKEQEWDMMKNDFVSKIQELSELATRNESSARMQSLSVAPTNAAVSVATDPSVRTRTPHLTSVHTLRLDVVMH